MKELYEKLFGHFTRLLEEEGEFHVLYDDDYTIVEGETGWDLDSTAEAAGLYLMNEDCKFHLAKDYLVKAPSTERVKNKTDNIAMETIYCKRWKLPKISEM